MQACFSSCSCYPTASIFIATSLSGKQFHHDFRLLVFLPWVSAWANCTESCFYLWSLSYCLTGQLLLFWLLALWIFFHKDNFSCETIFFFISCGLPASREIFSSELDPAVCTLPQLWGMLFIESTRKVPGLKKYHQGQHKPHGAASAV